MKKTSVQTSCPVNNFGESYASIQTSSFIFQSICMFVLARNLCCCLFVLSR